ncbi:MAG: cobalt ECF transporter T component CbiQ [Candidatus Margulisbacteria bacterium]|nr:cobalt ECF transporter T component CbiQ [Candidatus Margulisiibacteriota bacterium]
MVFRSIKLPLRKHDFLEGSILGAISFIKEATLYEEYAARPAFLQTLDPRIKVVSFLFLLMLAVLLKNNVLIGCIYCFCLMLTFIADIPLLFFLGRTWLFIPLFSLFMVFPSLFSFITPGASLWSMNLGGVTLSITKSGLAGALLFVTRIATTVSLVVLLSLTTRHTELLKVLRTFRVPQIFVMTLSMCYRYIYLYATIVENSFTAIKSRVGKVTQHKRGQRLVTGSMATTWRRSVRMSEEIYNAMLSRGYTGNPVILTQHQTKIADWLWLPGVIIFGLILMKLEYQW